MFEPPPESELLEAEALRTRAGRLSAKANAVEDGTLALFRANATLRTEDVVNATGVSAQAVNNRLRKLWNTGWLSRQRTPMPNGGKLYVYTATPSFLRYDGPTDG